MDILVRDKKHRVSLVSLYEKHKSEPKCPFYGDMHGGGSSCILMYFLIADLNLIRYFNSSAFEKGTHQT